MENNSGEEPLLDNPQIAELDKIIFIFQKDSEALEASIVKVDSKESLLGEMYVFFKLISLNNFILNKDFLN